MSILAAAVSLTVGLQSTSIKDYIQSNLQDASFTAKKINSNQKELQKINKDFAASYRFDFSKVQLKEPFMLRLESQVEDQSIVYILNGVKRRYRIPKAGIDVTEDLSVKPGRRQTPLDFGILTPSLFNGLFLAKFIRLDAKTKDVVFDLTYPEKLDDSTRNRVWIDPEKKIITKREWYSQNGGFLIATFYYENVKNFGGVWVPTQLSVKNAENKLAGTMGYTEISINKGIPASVFSLK